MNLNHDNWRVYAAKHYTNNNCVSVVEFNEDIGKVALAKKLIKKWQSGGKINVRLLLNHIILFTNVFEIQAAKDILMLQAGKEFGSVMKTLLLYLNFIAEGEYPTVKYNLKMAKALKELT